MRGGDLAYLRVQAGIQRLYERGLPHPGFAREERHSLAAEFPKFVDSLPRLAGGLDYQIASAFVYADEVLHFLLIKVSVKVDFIEDYHRLDAVDFAGDEDTVEEGQLDFREKQAHGYHRPVQIGRNHVILAAEVGGFTDHIVPPRKHVGDDCGVFIFPIANHISDSDGVGGGASGETHLSAEHGRERLPLRKAAQQEMAARILYHYGFVGVHFTLPVRLFTNSSNASSLAASSPRPATASIAFREYAAIAPVASLSTPRET